jgi:transcription elongation factor GreA
MEKFPITVKGFAKLQEEIKHLKAVERPQVIKAIASARELGDLSENAEYHAAREKQGFLEGKIIDLEDKSARAEVIDTSKLSGDIVRFV